MKKFINLSSVLIFVLCIIILFQKYQKSSVVRNTITVAGKPYEVIKHEIDTIEVVKTKIKTIKGDSIPFEVLVHDTLWKSIDVDTMAIIKNYFAKLIYRDTLKLDDSLGTVVVIDTISENKIVGRVWEANVRERIVKELTIVKEMPKRQVFIGADATFNKVNLINSVGGGLIYKDKRDALYKFNLGLSNTGDQLLPYIGGGVYWKISLKK
jgi:hypothetical protein